MNFLFGLLPTAIVLGILILVHEFGHFIACRLSGVRVEKFSIGFGPKLLSLKGKETEYAISLFPFGGYVKPSGESASELEGGQLRPYDYLAAPVWKRIFIVAAGVLMNYVLSFVLFAAIYMIGRPVPLAQIGEFVKDYPAEASGLKKGDRVVTLEGAPVKLWADLTEKLNQVSREEVTLQVVREGKELSIRVPVRLEPIKDVFGKTHVLPRVGILPDQEAFEIEKLPFPTAIREAFITEVNLAVMTYKGLFYLVSGRLSLKTISGPIGIMAMTGTAAKLGIVYLLHLTAVLGISLAVINLLPIPALDGGHLVFLIIEAVRGKQVSLKFQERVTQIGFTFLMILMVLVLYNDIVNLQVFDRIKAVFGR